VGLSGSNGLERAKERAKEASQGNEEEQLVATPNVANTLANVPIFSGCSKRELGIIARASKEVHHKEGTVIAREGERGIGLFLILDGQCKVTIGGKTKARLGPGDFFGEVALLDGGPRTATVTAVSPVRLVGITGWVFRGLLMEHPTIALKTLEAVAGRLRSVSKEPV
jgi:CRP/FNR family transcriptional regulator, cyclic AMP receptor protein